MEEEKKDETVVEANTDITSIGAFSYRGFVTKMLGYGANIKIEKHPSRVDELNAIFCSIGASANREVEYKDYKASAIEEYQAKHPAGLTCFHETYNISAFKHPPYFMECSDMEYREASAALFTVDDPTKKYSAEHKKLLYGHLPETASTIGHVFSHLLEDAVDPFISTCVRTIDGHERFIVTVWHKGVNGEASGYYAHGVWFNIHTPHSAGSRVIQ